MFLCLATLLVVMFVQEEKRNAYLISVMDLNVFGAIVGLIGRKWMPIYFAALPIVMIGRCFWAIFLLFQVREDGFMA